MVGAALRALDLGFQQFSEHCPIRQAGQRVVKSCMTEVVLGLFQYSADPFLFGDVVVELVDMAFRLLRALALNLGTCAFRFLRLARRCFHLSHVSIVAKIDNHDDWYCDQKGP